MTSQAALVALARTEVRLHWRHGVLAATVATTAVLGVALLALPPAWRGEAVTWLLLLEAAGIGFFFVPALTVLERANGVAAAPPHTRGARAAALAVRVGVVAVWAVAAGAVWVAVAGTPPLAALAGVALASLLLSLAAVAALGRHNSLTTYVQRSPAIAVPLIAPALIDGIGLWASPLLGLSPMTGARQLMAGDASWLTVAWIVAWIVGLAVAVWGVGAADAPAPTWRRAGGDESPRVAAPPRPGRWAAVGSLARVDRIVVAGDGLLVMVAAGVPIIALALRWFASSGVAWVQQTYGVDVAPHLPAVWALVIVVHVPVMAGSMVGLLFCEDRDVGVLPAVALTRSSLGTLVAYRLAAAAGFAVLAVVAGLVIAGASHAAGGPGVAATAVAGGAVATVPAMLMAAGARDRVHGIAIMKTVTLPLYLPVAWWAIDHPAGWLFALLPTGWAVQAFWAATPPGAFAFAGATVALSGVVVAAMLLRLRRTVG